MKQRECYICGSVDKLKYAYGDFRAIGVRGNVGWLLCPKCYKILFRDTERFKELLDDIEGRRT